MPAIVPSDIQAAFPNLDFVKKKAGEWASACPFCTLADQNGFIVWERGNYWCRKCGAKGHWLGTTNNTRREIGDGRRERTPEATHEPYTWGAAAFFHDALLAQSDVVAWLETRYGISRDVLIRAQVGYGALPRSRDKVNQRILVPVPTDDGQAVKGFVGRVYLDPQPIPFNDRWHDERNRVPDTDLAYPDKWLTSAGTSGTLYGLGSVETGQPYIHVGEGKFKALALHTAGYAAGTSTSGSAHFPDSWVARIIAAGASACYLWYDNDDAGRKGAAKAHAAFARLAPDFPCYIVEWPDSAPDKADINDVLAPLAPERRAAHIESYLAHARGTHHEQPAPEPTPAKAAGRRKARTMHVEAAPVHPTASLADIRDGMLEAILQFIGKDEAGALLLSPWPGSGKTTALIGALEFSGKRVFYAGPRKDLWHTIKDASVDAGVVYGQEPRVDEWRNIRPRSGADEYGDANCHWPEAAKAALAKRRDVMRGLCMGACGMWGECAYSQSMQWNKFSDLAFGRHQHVFHSDLPKSYDVIVLDESFVKSAIEEIVLSVDALTVSADAPEPAQRLARALRVVAAMHEEGAALDGVALLPALDAALADDDGHDLYTTLGMVDQLDDVLFGEPADATPSQIAKLPTKWFPDVYRILRDELAAQPRGAWNSRIVVEGHTLRYYVVNVPRIGNTPVIIADATGSEALYTKLLGRTVEVYRPVPEQRAEVWQYIGRMNGKASLSDSGGTSWRDTEALLRHFAGERDRTLVVSYKSLTERVQALALPGVEAVHYAGVAGSNAWKDYDQVVLAGSYMPPRESIVRRARALWHDDPQVVDDTWIVEHRPYLGGEQADGSTLTYPVTVPLDARARLLVEQGREAEMVQALERIRTLIGETQKRVILLTALPIPSIRVARFFDIADVVEMPQSEYAAAMQQWICDRVTLDGSVPFAAIDAYFVGLGWSRSTIIKHRDAAIAALGLDLWAAAPDGRGRPAKVAGVREDAPRAVELVFYEQAA